jgi:hypothetical protein
MRPSDLTRHVIPCLWGGIIVIAASCIPDTDGQRRGYALSSIDCTLDSVTYRAALCIPGKESAPDCIALLAGTNKQRPVFASPNTDGEIASIADAGDLDGDGVNDVLISYIDPHIRNTACKLVCYSVAQSRVLGSVALSDEDQRMNVATRLIGDVDGDGFPDAVVFWPYQTPETVCIATYSVKAHRVLATKYLRGDSETNHLSEIASPLNSMTLLGDVDGDHVQDLAVCLPLGGSGGKVMFISGRTLGVIGELMGIIESSGFGSSCAVLGDIDHDGIPEFAIGAPLEDCGSGGQGVVRVYSGKDRKEIASVAASSKERAFGLSMCSIPNSPSDDHGLLAVLSNVSDIVVVQVDPHQAHRTVQISCPEGESVVSMIGMASSPSPEPRLIVSTRTERWRSHYLRWYSVLSGELLSAIGDVDLTGDHVRK